MNSSFEMNALVIGASGALGAAFGMAESRSMTISSRYAFLSRWRHPGESRCTGDLTNE